MQIRRLIGKVVAFNKDIVGYVFISVPQSKEESLSIPEEALNLEQSYRIIASNLCENAVLAQGEVECTDGSIDALATFNAVGKREDQKVVVISKIMKGDTRIGFDVFLPGGKIVTLRYDQVVSAVERFGATNAKVIHKEGGRILSATKGTFKERIIDTPKDRVTSSDIVVTNTLMFSNEGNIRMGTFGLVTTGAIVGYRIMNIGKYPLEYKTTYYRKSDKSDFYVSEERTVQLYPGQHADLTRKYFALMGLSDQFTLQFGNGKLIRGAGRVEPGNPDAELTAHYFVFNDKRIKIYDPNIILQIGQEVRDEDKTRWIVKPEFEMTFGFLNNPRVRRATQ